MTTSNKARAAAKETKKEEARRRMYFHRDYHPQGPPSRQIQQLFEETVLQPPGKVQFNSLAGDIPLDATIVANHRAPNLGNILSYRKLYSKNGPNASFYEACVAKVHKSQWP
ncbi:hypothetical protein ACHAWF_010951 [Thalassiosira exigua]